MNIIFKLIKDIRLHKTKFYKKISIPSLQPVVNPNPENVADTLNDLFGTNTDPPPPEKYTNCGVHNRAGLKRGGVSVSFTHSNGKPVTSQVK